MILMTLRSKYSGADCTLIDCPDRIKNREHWHEVDSSTFDPIPPEAECDHVEGRAALRDILGLAGAVLSGIVIVVAGFYFAFTGDNVLTIARIEVASILSLWLCGMLVGDGK